METVTSRDGTRIAFDRHGDGPGLIIVGGATQHRAVDETTDELARLLAEHFTVLHYDRRGRGDSGDTQPFAPAREHEDIAALVEVLDGEVSVFGMSSGGVLALDAAQSGVPLRRLAVYEPPVRPNGSGPPLDHDYVSDLHSLLAAGRNGDAMARFMTMVGMPASEVEGFRQTPAWPAFEAVAPTLAYDAATMDPLSQGEPPPPSQWDRVTQPVLVLEGGESPQFMRDGAAAVAGALPNAKRLTLPGQTHSFEPVALAPALVEFLAG